MDLTKNKLFILINITEFAKNYRKTFIFLEIHNFF